MPDDAGVPPAMKMAWRRCGVVIVILFWVGGYGVIEMGSQDGGEETSAQAGAIPVARSRNAASWETLCQAAPWGQGKDVPTTPATPAVPPVTLKAASVAVVEPSPAAPSPAATEDADPPAVVHHSLFEAFDAWTQMEGGVPAAETARSSVASSPFTAAASEHTEATRSSGGAASFYAWVETEGGLSAAGSAEAGSDVSAAPVATIAVSEPAPGPELKVPSLAPSEPLPKFASALVSVSVSIEPAPAESLVEAPTIIVPPAPEPAPVVAVAPAAVEPAPPVRTIFSEPVAPKPTSRAAVDAATMEALAAEMVPMATRPAPLGVPVASKASPKAKPKTQAHPSPVRSMPVSSLFSAVISAAGRAVKGVAPAAGKPVKKPATSTPAAKPAPARAQTAARTPATKPPARPKPVVQRLLGAVEREVGIAFGALKSVGYGLVRQAQSVVAPENRSNSAPKKRPASAARGR